MIPKDVLTFCLYSFLSICDCGRLKKTCKYFNEDSNLREIQNKKLNVAINTFPNWKRKKWKHFVSKEQEYMLQQRTLITRDRKKYILRPTHDINGIIIVYPNFEHRILCEGYDLSKKKEIFFWNGIDHFAVIIKNNTYLFHLPDNYPIDPPTIECISNCGRFGYNLVVKSDDIKNWSPAHCLEDICLMIENILEPMIDNNCNIDEFNKVKNDIDMRYFYKKGIDNQIFI